ncbi:hypothetical protein [Novosphingobium sp. ST904]|uniref:hypothetical protein n=1 Tax=Novosphingobium sp. ST904 TaxID=1684385 RepID=UPI001043E3A6|nr:hypothetical protein [Novosphingobium sp. ST904]TCM40107.1 hypothetical protein EDF59_105347 [Novosphingobium sp. ST904]
MAGVQAGRLNIEIVAEVARLQADMDRIKKLVKAGSDDIAKSAKAANDNIASLGDGVTKMGNNGRLAGHQVQNLVYQLQDLGVQMAGAAASSKPLKLAFLALMQQGSQIQGIMSQAGIGVKGLAAELLALLAPFAPIIIAAGLLAGAIGLLTSDINENSKVHVTWMDTLLGIYDAIKSYVSGALTDAFAYFGTTSGDVWNTVVEWTKWAANKIIALQTVVPIALRDSWKQIPAGIADIFISGANMAIDAINGLIRKAVDGVNGFVGQANTILDKFGLHIGTLGAPQVEKLANSYAGAGVKLGNTLAKSVSTTMQRDFLGEMAGAISPFAQARAVERMKKDAKKAGKETGAEHGKAAGKQAAEDFISVWRRELQGNVIAMLMNNQAADWAEFTKKVDNLGQAAWDANKEAQGRAREAAEAYNDELRHTIGLLGDIGGLGQGVGALLGIVSGNTSAVGGALGDFLNLGIGMTTDANGKPIAKTIGDELSKVFKPGSDFANTMSGALQAVGFGVQVGSMTDSLFDSLGVESSKLGSQIGGAIGSAVLGPLGAIGGSIVGGLVGGMFKSTKWGRVDVSSSGVSSTVGNSGASERAAATAGNSFYTGLQSVADALGGTLGDFGTISLGQRHGDYRVNTGGTSLKVKNGAVDFNDDAEAAIAYAIQQAISRGAITGVRASTQNLLKESDDLQANIEKALKFEGVFTELQSLTDPLGYALDTVTKEFDQLRDIFKAAGASAAEYAQLEELLAIKRQDAIDSAMKDMVEQYSDQNGLEVDILNLLGRSEEALAAQRLAELAATKQSLQPMQALVYQLEDLNDVVDTFGPLADDLKAFKKELLGGDTAAGFAQLAATFRSTADLAKQGDATALGNLRGVSTDYLDAALQNAGSAIEYQRALGEVLAAVDQGIFAADEQVDYAQAQIDAINKNFDLTAQMKEELATYQKAIVEGINYTNRLWSRFEGDGLPVRTDSDTPLQVEVVS